MHDIFVLIISASSNGLDEFVHTRLHKVGMCDKYLNLVCFLTLCLSYVIYMFQAPLFTGFVLRRQFSLILGLSYMLSLNCVIKFFMSFLNYLTDEERVGSFMVNTI